MAVLAIGILLSVLVPAIHQAATTKKAAQALSRRVASENAAVTGLYGKEKRPTITYRRLLEKVLPQVRQQHKLVKIRLRVQFI